MYYRIVRTDTSPSGMEVYCDGQLLTNAVYGHIIAEYGYVPGKRREDARMRLFCRVGKRYRTIELEDGDTLEFVIRKRKND